MFPPLCQILKEICHRPGRCCSLYQEQVQTSVTTTIGTIQIMVGLLNIGLGPGRTSTHAGDVTSLGAAYWLATVFIVTGILSILAGHFLSSCLVSFTVFMNIAAAIFAMTGTVLYIIDVQDSSLLWMCDPRVDEGEDNCRKLALIAQSLLRSMDITLIIFTTVQLFVSVLFAILGIKALTEVEDEQGEQNVEDKRLKLKKTSPGSSNYLT